MSQTVVSLKNTKQDILRAYEELLNLRQAVTAKTDSSEKQDDFRSKILSKVEEIEKYISNKKDEAKELILQIEELKQQVDLGKKIKFSSDALKEIEIKIESEKKDWERKKIQLETETEEKIKWEKKKFDKELEQKKWEFDKNLEQKNIELKERQEKFDEKLKEFELLKKQIGEFPNLIEKSEKEKEIEITKTLKKEFESEKMFFVQESESDKKLLSQKVSDLESRLKDQIGENQNLRNQISSLQEKFKEVAVATIKSEISNSSPASK